MYAAFCRILVVCLLLCGCARAPAGDLNGHVPDHLPETVIVYVRTGCPYCGQALDSLAHHGVVPLVRNASRDRSAYLELQTLYREHFPGQEMIVPVIGKRGTYLRGFNRFSIEELLYDLPLSDPEDFDFCD